MNKVQSSIPPLFFFLTCVINLVVSEKKDTHFDIHLHAEIGRLFAFEVRDSRLAQLLNEQYQHPKCLPVWLTWRSESSLLMGIPSLEDIGEDRALFKPPYCSLTSYPNITISVYSSVLRRRMISSGHSTPVGNLRKSELVQGRKTGNNNCYNKYPVALSIILPFDSSFSYSYLASSNTFQVVWHVFNRMLHLNVSADPIYAVIDHPERLKLLCSFRQPLDSRFLYRNQSVQYLVLSYQTHLCQATCSSDILNNTSVHALKVLQSVKSLPNASVVLTQFQAMPVDEFRKRIQQIPWRSVRSAQEDMEPESSGFIDDTPTLMFNKSVFEKSRHIPEGQYFSHCVHESALILNSVQVSDLNNFEMVLSEVAGGGGSGTWITWNKESHCVEGLPMSQQEGFNTFYLTCTYKFNRMITARAPLEILVFKNKNLPNHKFGFKLKYNFTNFFTRIHIKLDVLSNIAKVMERPRNELTVDRYSHTKGAQYFELWISVHSVGYLPCSDQQLSQINTYLSRLTDTDPVSYELLPSAAISSALSGYHLETVSVKYLGPCIEKLAQISSQSGVIDSTSLEPEPGSFRPEMQSHSIFSSPVVFVVIIATVLLIVIIVLFRSRSNDSCLRQHKANMDARNFMNVKTKNVPVVFAEEMVDLQATNMANNSYKANNHHKPIQNDFSTHQRHNATSACSMCSTGHTPPPPPPPPPALADDLKLSQIFSFPSSAAAAPGNSYTLPLTLNRNVAVEVATAANHMMPSKYCTLNHNNVMRPSQQPISIQNHSNSLYHQVNYLNADLDQSKSPNVIPATDLNDCKSPQSSFSQSFSKKLPQFTNHANQVPPTAMHVPPASFQSDSPRSSSSSSFRQMTAAMGEVSAQQMQQSGLGILGNHASTLSPSSANSPSSDFNMQDLESPGMQWTVSSVNHNPYKHQNGGLSTMPHAQYTAVVGSGTNKVAGIQLLGPGARHAGSGASNSPVAVLFSPSIEHEV